jgi:hypothetical protein
MQTIYQPGLASENCYFVPATMIGSAVIVGVVLMLLLARFMPRSAPHFRTMTVALLAVPVMIVGVAGQRVLSGAESIVRIATDGSHLEYHYCSRLTLQVERHPLTSLMASHYRREVEHRRDSPARIHHKLDLQFWGRAAPITISLDASATDVNLDLAESIAPAAVQKFRADQGR